jgi:hypothetical protein
MLRGGEVGPGVRDQLFAWSLHHPAAPMMDSFHCEPLQHVVEYGLLGGLALGAFAWRVGAHLQLGDPWSAGVVAAGVLALGTTCCRVPPTALLCLAVCARVAQ